MVYGQASPPTIDCLKCLNHRVSQSTAQSNTEFLVTHELIAARFVVGRLCLIFMILVIQPLCNSE
jgi:hypothetical protein